MDAESGTMKLVGLVPKAGKRVGTVIYGSSDVHVGKNLTIILFRYKLDVSGKVIGLNRLALD